MAEEMNGNGEYKLGTEHRLTKLESNYSSLDKNVNEIKNNHLVHIQQSLDEINGKIFWGICTLAVTLGGVVVDLAMRFGGH